MATNEAFSRVLIDAMLTAQGWSVADPNAVRFEVVMPDSTRADYAALAHFGDHFRRYMPCFHRWTRLKMPPNATSIACFNATGATWSKWPNRWRFAAEPRACQMECCLPPASSSPSSQPPGAFSRNGPWVWSSFPRLDVAL